MRTAIISSLVLAATVSAQTQHVVTVSSFQFTPNSITAAAGDKVTFVFAGSPGLHSVTQSTFANPCTALEGGFNSGFVNVTAGTKAPFEEYSLTVTNASQPIWFYCAQTLPGPHCTFGMVGAINAPSSGNTIDAFVSKAVAVPAASVPTSLSAGVDSPTGGVNISAVAAVATGTDAAASSTAPPNSVPPTAAASSGAGASGSSSGNGTASPSSTGKSDANSLTGFTTVGAAIFAVLFGVTL